MPFDHPTNSTATRPRDRRAWRRDRRGPRRRHEQRRERRHAGSVAVMLLDRLLDADGESLPLTGFTARAFDCSLLTLELAAGRLIREGRAELVTTPTGSARIRLRDGAAVTAAGGAR
jgi:hypothetical protein